MEKSGKNPSTSVKHDDAAVPTFLWDRRISDVFPSVAPAVVTALQGIVLKYVKQCLLREFINYLQKEYPEDFSRYTSLRLQSHMYNKGGNKGGAFHRDILVL